MHDIPVTHMIEKRLFSNMARPGKEPERGLQSAATSKLLGAGIFLSFGAFERLLRTEGRVPAPLHLKRCIGFGVALYVDDNPGRPGLNL